MRAAIRRLLESAGFSPRQLFAALQGAWLEPTPGFIWQENTGVTPTTTGGQTIGLMLDQSQGAVLGPELVTNGDFSNGTTGWSAYQCTLAVTSGQLVVTSTVAGNGYVAAYQTISGLTAGKSYQITVGTIVSGFYTVYDGAIASGALLPGSSASGSRVFVATDSDVTLNIFFTAASIGQTATFDSVSVREILGNHAYQSVSGSRPTYQLDSNNLPLARHDTTDNLVVSLPDLGGGVFSNAGSVYFATPVGMSQLNNQSMGSTYTLPALSSDIYSWIVVPQRLSAVLESRLERYMLRKANLTEPDYLLDDDGNQLMSDDYELLLRQ